MTVTTGGRATRSSSSPSSSPKSMSKRLEQLAVLVLRADDLDVVVQLGAEQLQRLVVTDWVAVTISPRWNITVTSDAGLASILSAKSVSDAPRGRRTVWPLPAGGPARRRSTGAGMLSNSWRFAASWTCGRAPAGRRDGRRHRPCVPPATAPGRPPKPPPGRGRRSRRRRRTDRRDAPPKPPPPPPPPGRPAKPPTAAGTGTGARRDDRPDRRDAPRAAGTRPPGAAPARPGIIPGFGPRTHRAGAPPGAAAGRARRAGDARRAGRGGGAAVGERVVAGRRTRGAGRAGTRRAGLRHCGP